MLLLREMNEKRGPVVIMSSYKEEKTIEQNAFVQGTIESDVRRLGKGAAVALLGRMGGRAFTLTNQVILARLLGPTTFGLYALGWTILQMAGTIVTLGIPQAVVRFGSPAWRSNNGYLRAVLQRSLQVAGLLSLMAGLTLFLSAQWLADSVFQKPGLTIVFQGFSLAVVLLVLLRVIAAGTRISQRMQFSVLIEDLTQPAVQLLLVGMLVIVAGQGLQGAVLSTTVGFVLAVALGILFLWRLFGNDVRHVTPVPFRLRELVAFSVPASMAGIFTMLTLRVDRLLVGYFLPASDVGIYQVATQAAMLAAMILGAFNAIFSPMIARLYHQDQLGRLNELFKVSTKWGLYVSLPVFLVLAVAPREVITLVFGEAYAASVVPMLIMAGAQLFNAATGAVGILLILSGHPKRWFVISSGAFVANVLLCVILIPLLGTTGAALAVAAAVVLLFGWGLIDVRRLLGLWPYDRRYWKVLLAALGSLVVLMGTKAGFPLGGLHRVLWFTRFTVSGMATFGVLVLLGSDAEDRELLRAMLAKIRSVYS